MGLQDYLNARRWVAQENLNDFVTALQSGYWEDILHFIGGDSESQLSWRMMVRRAWARKTLLGQASLDNPPELPPYGMYNPYIYGD